MSTFLFRLNHLNYLIKLFGHSGSSIRMTTQAVLPKPANTDPTVAKTEAKNPTTDSSLLFYTQNIFYNIFR